MKLLDDNLHYTWNLLTPRGKQLGIYVLLLVMLVEAIAICVPYGLGQIAAGLGSNDFDLVLFGVTYFIVVDIATHAAHWGLFRVRERFFQQCFWSIPYNILDQYLEKPIGWLIDNEHQIDGGGVESLRDKVMNMHDQYLFNIVPNYCSISFGVVVCFAIDSWIGMAACGFILIQLIWNSRFNAYMTEACLPIDTEFRRWIRWMRERADAAVVMKAYGTVSRILRELHERVQPALALDDYVYRVRFAKSITLRRLSATALIVGISLWLGSSNNEDTLGTDKMVWLLLVLREITIRLRDIADAERMIARDRPRVQGYRVPLQEPAPFLATEGEPFEAEKLTIDLRAVSLSLKKEGVQTPILRNVSLTLNPGERVGIIGPSGAGKTKLIELFLRAYAGVSGEVTVNNQSFSDIRLEDYLAHVGYIPQDIEIFEGTIRDNVLSGIGSGLVVSDEEIWDVLNRAGLDFSVLTNGLNTNVGYQGLKLSGGQRQRLAIAIALAKRPKLIIGDEMTSALDSISEVTVMSHIYGSLPKDVIVMMIAHRLSTLRGCDKIIFVRPIGACGADAEQVTVYTSLHKAYESEALFREMADAQGFQL